jgi:hypothetical protein
MNVGQTYGVHLREGIFPGRYRDMGCSFPSFAIASRYRRQKEKK